MKQYSAKHSGRTIELEHRQARAKARTVALATTAAAGPSQTRIIELMLAAIATLVIPMALLVPTDLVLPSVSIAALGLAAIIASITWHLKVTEGKKNKLNLRDAAGVLALIGFGAGMVSEPEAVMQILVGQKP